MPGAIDETGNTYGRLTVITRVENDKHGNTQWECRCDCGDTTIVRGVSLRSGHTKSCGCLNQEKIAQVGREGLNDLTGNKYGRLTVVSREPNSKWGKTRWLCECECGNQTIVRSNDLANGKVRSCGCLRNELSSKRCFCDETGNRYGRLKVIEQAGISEHGQVLWICQCDCGKQTTVIAQSLRDGKTRSCGCLRKDLMQLPEGEAAMRSLFRRYSRGAKDRGLCWDLTKEQFDKLTSMPCHYCGAEPYQMHEKDHFNGGCEYTGIDRIDNSEGYIPENVVPCCKKCNMAKRALGYHEFLDLVEAIVWNRGSARL